MHQKPKLLGFEIREMMEFLYISPSTLYTTNKIGYFICRDSGRPASSYYWDRAHIKLEPDKDVLRWLWSDEGGLDKGLKTKVVICPHHGDILNGFKADVVKFEIYLIKELLRKNRRVGSLVKPLIERVKLQVGYHD